MLDVLFWELNVSLVTRTSVMEVWRYLNCSFYKKKFFQPYIFSNFWSSKPLDPDWIRIPIKWIRFRNPAGPHAYIFVSRILSTSLTYVSIFSDCCCSRSYSSMWSTVRPVGHSVRGITMIFTFPTGRQHISGSYKEMTVQEVDARLTVTNTRTVFRTVFYLFSQDVKGNR